jgi:hypothetical protein
MQSEIGRELRSEYELPLKLPANLVDCVNRLEGAFAAAQTIPRSCGPDERCRRLLQRAMASESAAGSALNEGIKEIYLDLAAQWRDLARRQEMAAAAENHK